MYLGPLTRNFVKRRPRTKRLTVSWKEWPPLEPWSTFCTLVHLWKMTGNNGQSSLQSTAANVSHERRPYVNYEFVHLGPFTHTFVKWRPTAKILTVSQREWPLPHTLSPVAILHLRTPWGRSIERLISTVTTYKSHSRILISLLYTFQIFTT